jgi:uncharacterized protein YkwD
LYAGVKVRIHSLIAAALSFALLAPPAGAFTATPKPAVHRTAQEALIVSMNRERAAHGLGPLRLNVQLALAAEDRANDMLAKHYFAHVAPDGRQPWFWVDKRGYAYTEVGENLAVGYLGQSIVDGWMHSPEHRENVLKPEFDEVGIAIVAQSPARMYRGPLVVALYGTRG